MGSVVDLLGDTEVVYHTKHLPLCVGLKHCVQFYLVGTARLLVGFSSAYKDGSSISCSF